MLRHPGTVSFRAVFVPAAVLRGKGEDADLEFEPEVFEEVEGSQGSRSSGPGWRKKGFPYRGIADRAGDVVLTELFV